MKRRSLKLILIPSVIMCGITLLLSTLLCIALVPSRHAPDLKIRETDSPDTSNVDFPKHVREWEEINHPGMEALNKTLMIKVPTFYTHSSLPAKGLLTLEQAQSIGTKYKGEETIFLSIASYRDPECRKTLADAFNYAKHPERIRVAIVDQIEDDDVDCITPTAPCTPESTDPLCVYRKNIDYFKIASSLATGPVFARHLAHRMYRGEYFAAQIDAHVRFTKDWDDDIVLQWKLTENEMAVLSTYVSEINKHLNLDTRERIIPVRPIMCNTRYLTPSHPLAHLAHAVQPEMKPLDPKYPILHPFWAAGFSFARGHFVMQVPYDQYMPMVFQGEEISMGIRGFTFGYDYYAPPRNVIYHMYASEHPERKTVKKYWEHAGTYPEIGRMAMRRLNTIIKQSSWGDEWNSKESDKYGLGPVRPVEKFYDVFGIDRKNHTVQDKLCKFVERKMTPMFKQYMREDHMGIDYSKIEFEYKFDPTAS